MAPMIMVVGGAFSGRRKYALSLASSLSGTPSSLVHVVSDDDVSSFASEKDAAYPALSRTVARISSFPVVVATEIGCGVVPLSPEERAFRENNGRLNQALAHVASSVVLMCAGIPQVIKGTPEPFFLPKYAAVFRHGETAANRERRFAGGLSDVPLSSDGTGGVADAASSLLESLSGFRGDVLKAVSEPPVVFSSPMERAVSSARILFPRSEIRVVEDFREMRLGLLENMTHEELSEGRFADGSRSEENARLYEEWLSSNGNGACPSSADFPGESIPVFSSRVSAAFSAAMRSVPPGGVAVIVAHGGVQMALCSSFFRGAEGVPYFSWQSGNASFRFGEVSV